MFERLLIPLDGSPFAERALQPGFEMAKAFGAEVILVRVVTASEVVPALAPTYQWTSSLLLRAEAEAAEQYLRATRQQWGGAEVSVDIRVLAGAPAGAIVTAAQEAGVNLIVMSTHGRSAVGRIIYGSVAEAVLRGAQVPVLLIPTRLPH